MRKAQYIFIVLLVMISCYSYAQNNNIEDPVKTAQLHIDAWSKYIPAVTDDQRKQMVSVETWFISAAKEARADNTDSDALVARVKELSDERNLKMKNILSPSQYSRYLQIFASEAK